MSFCRYIKHTHVNCSVHAYNHILTNLATYSALLVKSNFGNVWGINPVPLYPLDMPLRFLFSWPVLGKQKQKVVASKLQTKHTVRTDIRIGTSRIELNKQTGVDVSAFMLIHIK